jgi:hypothetical protein
VGEWAFFHLSECDASILWNGAPSVYLSRRFTRWILGVAAITFAIGLAAPFILMATARLSWPAPHQEVAITGARIVDTATGTIAGGQTV